MYEVIIIGAGPGGYLLAERLGKIHKTAIIEKDKFGGTCLNVGCIPSKAILYSKKVYNYVKHSSDYGIETNENVFYNQEKVIEKKDKKVNTLVSGVEYKVKSNNVDIFKGTGYVLGKENNLFKVKVNDQVITGKKLIIATGSTSAIPPIKNLKEKLANKDPNILTNIEVLSLKELPKKIVIIGAGIIGLEMASYFEGLSEVVVVDFLPNIASTMDQELAQILYKYLIKKNITFKLDSQVLEVQDDYITIKNSKTNVEEKINFDKLLIATGRIPNTQNMGFENIGLAFNRLAIEVDDKLQTNIPNVYCIGDANGKLMLAHTAYRHADVVYHRLIGKTYDKVDYNTIPGVIYTTPEMASVGKTEEQLKKDNYDYQVLKLPLIYSGRFLVEVDDYQGLIKMLVDKKNKQILGIHIIGQYASEIISIGTLIIAKKLSLNLLQDVVFPHPSVAELFKDLIMLGVK
ncbi:MAG: dihydrolipoyl dehydrogenase [Mycoplasma sp.]|nr:dihydrolipoyl dehydrogenase [Mycoplasma sp.]